MKVIYLMKKKLFKKRRVFYILKISHFIVFCSNTLLVIRASIRCETVKFNKISILHLLALAPIKT